jgi:Protein of unknown function (DUF4012)
MNGDRQADGPIDQPRDDGGVEVQRAPHVHIKDDDDELVEKWREILKRRRKAEDELRRRRERDATSPPTRVPQVEKRETDDSKEEATGSEAASGATVSERVVDLRDGRGDHAGDRAIDRRSTPRPVEKRFPTPVVPPSPSGPSDPTPGNGDAPAPERPADTSPVRRIVDVRPTERKRRAVEPDLPEADERPRPAHAVAAARDEKREKRRKRLTWVVVAVALVIALLVADLVYVGLGMYDSLQSAKANLQRGRDALEAGRYDDAKRSFTQALGDSRSAVDLRKHPVFWMAERTAWTKNDSRALAALSEAGILTSTAGTHAVDAINSVGQTSQGFAEALYNDGEIRVSAASEAAPAINKVDVLLSDALELLETAPEASTNAVGDALEAARVDVGSASRLVRRASTVIDALPSLFGAEAPRRYLVVFQALSEIRGSGGVLEYYGVLKASNGRLTLSPVHPSNRLDGAFAPSDQVPGWFATRYRPFSALSNWASATFSPTFPAVAGTLMTMYENATGRSVDGVLAMDPIMLGLMTDATGPIQQAGFPEVVTSENAARVLMYEIYRRFEGEPEARDGYVIGLIEKTWRIITQGVNDVSELTAALSEAQATQHIKVYSQFEEDQNALQELGLAADPTSVPGHVQMVFHNNLAGNKIDYFLRRVVETSVELDSDGSATVTSTAVIENRAPRDEDVTSFIAGPVNDRPAYNRMNLSWILPEGAQVTGINKGPRGRGFQQGLEATLPAVSGNLDIPPDGTATVSVEYEIPRAVDLSSGRGEFRFTLFPQTAPYADNFTLMVTPPPGHHMEELEGDGVTTDDGYGIAGTLDRPVTVQLGLTAE